MKFPLVGRERYELLLRDNERLMDDLRAARERLAEAQRFAATALASLTRMTEQLAAKPSDSTADRKAVPQAILPLPTPFRDEVQDAIELASGTDSALARHLSRWAQRQKLDGVKEHDIIQAILHWKTADVWDGAEDDVPSAF